jgi:hypothetical protein
MKSFLAAIGALAVAALVVIVVLGGFAARETIEEPRLVLPESGVPSLTPQSGATTAPGEIDELRRKALAEIDGARRAALEEISEARLAASMTPMGSGGGNARPAEPPMGVAIEPGAASFALMERNDVYTVVSWQVTFLNRTNAERSWRPKVRLLDASGFVVSEGRGEEAVIGPGQSIVCSESTMVNSDVVDAIARVEGVPVAR